MNALPLLILLSVIKATGTGYLEDHQPVSDHRTYSTGFDLSENPLSENGNWINGKVSGLDWSDVSSMKGLAIGHQQGNTQYVDATALLTGRWASDQAARATVFAGKTYPQDYPEVELRLRSTLSAHLCSGYEIAFSVAGKTDKAYLIIVRWNGPVGDFTYLRDLKGPQYGVKDGDVIKAVIKGSTITAYINGIEMAQVTDTVYRSGNPGMGFNFDWAGQTGPTGTNESYGFSEFSATDDPAKDDF